LENCGFKIATFHVLNRYMKAAHLTGSFYFCDTLVLSTIVVKRNLNKGQLK